MPYNQYLSNKSDYIRLMDNMTGGAQETTSSETISDEVTSSETTSDEVISSETTSEHKSNKPYELIKLDITKDEIEHNQNLKVKNRATYGYYGEIDKIDYSELKEFVENIGENTDKTIETINSSIQKIIKQFTDYHKENYRDVDSVWISIRPTKPMDDFKIPRWHRDGPYFTKEKGEKTYKFATCLKGPTTLFIKDEHTINEFDKIFLAEREKQREMKFESFEEQIKYDNKVVRPKLAEVIGKDYESVPDNYGLIFLGGDPDAVVHSEPDKDTDRLFISILPGSFEQIKQWKK